MKLDFTLVECLVKCFYAQEDLTWEKEENY